MKDKIAFNFGWIIVGISFVTLALAYGVWYSFSVFFVALLKEFGWSRSLAAGAFSIFVILHSLIGPFVGIMVDRLGPRRVILLGSLFLGVGLALCSLIKTWWQFYIFFGVITAVGVGSIGWVPNTTIIQHWFKEKRGLPIGIISSGIGILVCIPSIQHLITRVGWRVTYLIMAFSIPSIIATMAITFLKRHLQTTEFRQIKEGVSPVVIKDPLVVNEEWVARSWTIRQAIATKPFWLLSLAFF
jgi:MFS family permease